jgi:hypothetical protein
MRSRSHIIAEYISNERQNVVWENLVENNLLIFARCGLKLLLNKSRAMLITAELYYMTKDVLSNSLPLVTRAT